MRSVGPLVPRLDGVSLTHPSPTTATAAVHHNVTVAPDSEKHPPAGIHNLNDPWVTPTKRARLQFFIHHSPPTVSLSAQPRPSRSVGCFVFHVPHPVPHPRHHPVPHSVPHPRQPMPHQSQPVPQHMPPL